MKAINWRAIHRDLGYFYIGLIVSFAFSGILMNHRQIWHPEKYTIERKEINIPIPIKSQIIDEVFAKKTAESLGILSTMKRHQTKGNQFRLIFENADLEIDLLTGKGEIVSYIKTPIVSHMMKLHKNTDNIWIYYSDIFGISLIVIAITGVTLIKAGKNTFAQRGWKLALAGILFPLVTLLLLS